MKETQKRPNVIVFFTDQQRWDTSGLHGNPLQLMPNFDRMAMEGTHFYNTFTCQPVCGPARSCLQTGRFATETGVYKNGLPLDPSDVTLAKLFNEAGYKTAYVGKWHLSGVKGHFNMGDEPVPKHLRGGYEYWLGAELMESVSEAYETYLFDNDNKRVFLPGYRVDAVTDAAIDYVKNRDNESPFFLFLSLLEPHYQNTTDYFPPPTGYRENFTGRWTPPDLAALKGSAFQHLGGYYGMVKRIDEAFGRMLDAVKSMGLDDDTIILFTSDHGCHFKTRNNEYKRSCHESSIRIPAAASGPGFRGGGRVEGLASLLDFTPTLLEACNIPVPEEMQGHSLMPMVTRESDSVQDSVFIQISESQVGRSIRTKRWKYSVRAEAADSYADMDADTYTEDFLYDLETDPYELNNLIGYTSHEKVAELLRKKLIDRMVAAGERAPVIKPVERVPYYCQMTVREHEMYQ